MYKQGHKAAIRYYNEPEHWHQELSEQIRAKLSMKSVTITDSDQLKTCDKAWQWLCEALSIDCDVLLHIDCDGVVLKPLDLSCLDTEQPTVLAGAAPGYNIEFSTGVMFLNRAARILMLEYLTKHKPVFPMYNSNANGPVASIDMQFARLCSEIGIATKLSDEITWQRGCKPRALAKALKLSSIVANVRGRRDYD